MMKVQVIALWSGLIIDKNNAQKHNCGSLFRRPTQMSQMSNTSSLKKLTSRINGGTRGDVKIATGDTIDEAKELKDDSL